MYILPTLKEFIDNPMGKGSNAIPSRQLIRDDLRKRLHKMLTEKEKKIKLTIYKTKSSYYFHFLIPSESKERQNTYDVILEFFVDDDYKAAADERSLNNYRVRFFSNSPSFTYTYLYAFDLAGFFIKEFSNKFSKASLDNPPVTRNPGEIISYEKTIFFACIYLMNNTKYLDKMIVDPLAKPYNRAQLQRIIRTSAQIELEIQKEMRRVAREKEEHEKREKAERSRSKGERDKNKLQKIEKKQQTIGKVNKVNKITARHSSKSKIRPR